MSDGTRVAVTGIGGLLGRRLTDRLLRPPDRNPDAASKATSDGSVRTVSVLGLDIDPPDDLGADPRLELRTVDVRDAALADHLAGVDVLVHLAFIMDELDDLNAMRAINVDGTRNVFEAAVAAGVPRVVYTSSAVAYGAHPDNSIPLDEGHPLRANPDFAYAEHKLEVERWLADWLPEHPGVSAVVLRPALVAGPGVDNFLVRAITETVRPFIVKGYRPTLQFAHVDDVADALHHAVREDLEGAYNVACEGWLSFEEVVDLLGQSPWEVPEAVAFTLAERSWKLGLGLFPPGAVHYFMFPFVMSVDRLLATGWRPRHTNRETLQQLRSEHAAYVTLGRRVRARRRDVRVGLGLAGGLLAAAALRRVLRDRDA